MARHFFFYGTLRHDVAQGLPARLIEGLEPVGPATAAGRIFARRDSHGWYPVLFRGGIGRVRGIVCRAAGRLPGRALAALDRYEGAAGMGGEYVRRPVRAVLDGGGAVMADAYFFNRTARRELLPIPHGDFARWLAETGSKPFGS